MNKKSDQGKNLLENMNRTQKRDREAKVKNQKQKDNRIEDIQFPKISRLSQKIDSLERRIEGNKLFPQSRNQSFSSKKEALSKKYKLPLKWFAVQIKELIFREFWQSRISPATILASILVQKDQVPKIVSISYHS